MPPVTTTADLIFETRRHLQASQPEELNRINANVAANLANTTVTFTYSLKGIKPGVMIACGLELMHVWAVDESAQSATVVRAFNGSTLSALTAGDIVRVRPRWDGDFGIFKALNAELADLSSPTNGLYRVLAVDLTYNASTRGYNLTSVGDVIGEPLAVLAKSSGSMADWPEIRSWRYETNLPTADFASGKAIFLHQGGYQGQTVRVIYKAPFGALTALDNVVETVAGISSTAIDIPPLGAAIALLAGRPIKRSFTEAQPDSRRAEEVSVADVINAQRPLMARYEQRVRAEAIRLEAQYPIRKRGPFVSASLGG